MNKYIHKQPYLLLVLLTLISSCRGQNEAHSGGKGEQTILNGLPKILKPQGTFTDVSIDCATSDKAGNLWFGSNGEGVYIYNGKEFAHFTEKDGLDNNIVYSVLADRDGGIWVGTKTGLCRYNGKTFSRTPIAETIGPIISSSNSSNNNPSSLNGVWTMMQDKSGKIWFGTDDGVYCYDGTNFTRFLDNKSINNKDSLQLKAIFSIVEDTKGNIWMGSCIGEGLIQFDGKTVQRISPKGYARTQTIIEDKNGNIWFGSVGKGMCRYDGKTINTNFFKERDTHALMYLIWKDKTNNLWFSEPTANKPVHYYDGTGDINFAAKNNIPDQKMYPVVEDNDGNIWFASYGMNLYRYDGKNFTNFKD